MKRILFVLVASISISLVSCKKEESGIGSGTVDAKTILNVSYGSNSLQAMDVYLPANRSVTSTKVMVLIHGGAWSSGDKNDPIFLSTVDSLKRRLPDYAIFNINYRLSTGFINLFPAQEMDVKAAVEFIYAKRNEYGVSDKFVLAGASAGAHLAMLEAYKYNTPVKAKAVVSLFGIGDMTELYNNPVGGNTTLSVLLAQAVGKTPTQDPVLYSSSSPINYISSNTAMPTILLHGTADQLVDPQQSLAVKNKLTSVGINNQFVLYPGAGHGEWNSATLYNAYTNVQAFLTLYVP